MTLTPLTTYEDLHQSQQQAADEIYSLYETHAPDLHRRLTWNPENYRRPHHCGLVHDENDLASHSHSYFCSKYPQAVSEELKRIDAERVPRPFQGHWHNSDSLDDIPPLVPLLDGFFYRKTLSRIVGHSASFKSFVVLDMARAMGCGEDWHGVRTQPNGINVLIVVAEGAEGIRARKLALEQHYNRKLTNLYFLTRAIQIDASSRDWQKLTKAIKDNGIDLVFIDTQARCTIGIEENSNVAMSEVVDTLDRLIAATGVSVVLVHHSTGDQSTTGSNLKGRGAGAVRAALQSEIFVKRDRNVNLVSVTTDKSKDSASQKIVLEPVVRAVEGLTDYWGEKESSIVLLPPSPRIKGAVGGVPADTESAVVIETIEQMAERFLQLSGDKPTGTNIARVLEIRKQKALAVARYLKQVPA